MIARWTIALALFAAGSAAGQDLSGVIRIDGSSTVAPLMIEAGRHFESRYAQCDVQVHISGTGGGFKRLFDRRVDLRPDISGASRAIRTAEVATAGERDVAFVEVPLAYDGIAVVVHPSNRFCDSLTKDELRRIWAPGSTIRNWKDVRPGFPDRPLKLYGPGIESGTFDFFIDVVIGKGSACRSDFKASEDDNVIAREVAGDPGALGYFGYSYYEAHRHRLSLVAVDAGRGPVRPSLETIRDGRYRLLSRPLFLYVRTAALERPEVRVFLDELFADASSFVESKAVNCVALAPNLYHAARARLKARIAGSPASESEEATALGDLYLPGRGK